MSTSATPVQLIDPNTGVPYSAVTSDATTQANQTNGSQKTQVVGPSNVPVTVATIGTVPSGADSAITVRGHIENYNPVAVGFASTLGDNNGTFIVSKGGSNLATGQVAVGTSSTLVAAARANRQKITLSPTSSVVYYVGNAGVTTTTGLYVAAGGSITLDTNAAIYAAGASAVTISFIEYY